MSEEISVKASAVVECTGCIGGQCHRCTPAKYLPCPVCGCAGTGAGPDGTCLGCRGAGTLARDDAFLPAVDLCCVCGVHGKVCRVGFDCGTMERHELCPACLSRALGEALS